MQVFIYKLLSSQLGTVIAIDMIRELMVELHHRLHMNDIQVGWHPIVGGRLGKKVRRARSVWICFADWRGRQTHQKTKKTPQQF